MTDLVRAHTDLDAEDVAWLQLLMADWQILADLSSADLVLWLPDAAGAGWWAAGQMRPTTGPTALDDDVMGTFIPVGRRHMLDEAFAHGRIVREGDPEWRDSVPVRVEVIPVRRLERVIAVVARNTNLIGVRTPSRLELAYLQTAGDLTQMIANGRFPHPGQRGDHTDSPRVGDGFVRLDSTGRVTYASPNALSAFRRLGLVGDLDGRVLVEVARELIPARRRPDEETLSAVLGGRAARDGEIGTDHVTLVLRSIPLRPASEVPAALILVRDISELRRRDKELITKDVTIREIHHRVKNNLQTVAALLRLQARRIDSPAAKAALEEAVRRVGSIAIVHETLSQAVEEDVEFDDVVSRLASMVSEVSGVEIPIQVVRTGSFGTVPSAIATPLAMVLTELLQNAAEHGYVGADLPQVGRIEVRASRRDGRLTVEVIDDGVGLPDGFDPASSSSLGLSIVRTLMESELAGTLEMGPASSEAQLPTSGDDARGVRAASSPSAADDQSGQRGAGAGTVQTARGARVRLQLPLE